MSILNKPAIIFPRYQIGQKEMITVLEELFPNHPNWATVKRMIKNSKVDKRHIIRPIEETITHSGFKKRNDLYIKEGIKPYSPTKNGNQ